MDTFIANANRLRLRLIALVALATDHRAVLFIEVYP